MREPRGAAAAPGVTRGRPRMLQQPPAPGPPKQLEAAGHCSSYRLNCSPSTAGCIAGRPPPARAGPRAGTHTLRGGPSCEPAAPPPGARAGGALPAAAEGGGGCERGPGPGPGPGRGGSGGGERGGGAGELGAERVVAPGLRRLQAPRSLAGQVEYPLQSTLSTPGSGLFYSTLGRSTDGEARDHCVVLLDPPSPSPSVSSARLAGIYVIYLSMHLFYPVKLVKRM